MYARAKALADQAKPGNAGMRGFGDRSLHIEMKYRFCTTRTLFSQAPPSSAARSRRAVAVDAITDEINIGVIVIGRPMALEIVEERRPIGQQPMHLEIAQREGKPVVDADQRGRVLRQSLDQPFGDATPRPIFLGGRWRWNLDGRCIALGQIGTQALEARGWCLCARVIDADIPGEGVHLSSPFCTLH